MSEVPDLLGALFCHDRVPATRADAIAGKTAVDVFGTHKEAVCAAFGEGEEEGDHRVGGGR